MGLSPSPPASTLYLMRSAACFHIPFYTTLRLEHAEKFEYALLTFQSLLRSPHVSRSIYSRYLLSLLDIEYSKAIH
jgi:hypothetical protein